MYNRSGTITAFNQMDNQIAKRRYTNTTYRGIVQGWKQLFGDSLAYYQIEPDFSPHRMSLKAKRILATYRNN